MQFSLKYFKYFISESIIQICDAVNLEKAQRPVAKKTRSTVLLGFVKSATSDFSLKQHKQQNIRPSVKHLPFKSCPFKPPVINHRSALGTWRRCFEGSKFTYLFMTNDESYSQKKGKQGLGWGSAPQAGFLSEGQTTVKTIKANINHSDSHLDCTWRCWCCIVRFHTFTPNMFLLTC